MYTNHTKNLFWIVPTLLGVVIIVFVVVTLHRSPGGTPKKFSSENVQFQDLGNTLPVSFPVEIPVEISNITHAETLSYPDRKVTVYNVTYFSLRQQEEVFANYGIFLKQMGYTITKSEKTPTRMVYQATKGGNDLNIIITPQSGRINILVSYMKRG